MFLLEIAALEPDAYPEWDTFVAESPQGTIFHTSWWLDCSGHRFELFGLFKNGKLVAGLPIVYWRWRFWDMITQPPFTPYQGLMFAPTEGKYVTQLSMHKKLAEALIDAIKNRASVINICCHWTINDMQPFRWAGFEPQVHYTYLLDLQNYSAIWPNMDSTKRNNIRRSKDEGITVAEGFNIPELIRLSKDTFDRQSMNVNWDMLPKTYQYELNKRGLGRTFIAYTPAREAIAGLLLVWDNRCAYYLMGGYKQEAAHRGAMSLAFWQAINYAHTIGLQTFDFEGSDVPQIERFFRKFGARLTPYYRARKTSRWLESYLSLRRLLPI